MLDPVGSDGGERSGQDVGKAAGAAMGQGSVSVADIGPGAASICFFHKSFRSCTRGRTGRVGSGVHPQERRLGCAPFSIVSTHASAWRCNVISRIVYS